MNIGPTGFSNERRQHPRLANNIPLKISSEDEDVVTQTYNLSRTGVYCRVNKYLAPMTKLKIHLLLPLKKGGKTVTKKISCQGVVVRTEAVSGKTHYNAAIYFSDIQRKDADYIGDYVHEALEHNKVKSTVL